jgi:hypothetical protein
VADGTADDGCGTFVPRKDARLRLRDEIQNFTGLPSVRFCEAAPKGEAVGVHLPADGRTTTFSGLVRCGSVWSCPPCAASVRAVRAAELERWALAWLEAGHGLYMVTLTVPHWEHVRLEGEGGQLNKLIEAWRGVGQGAWWVGRAVIRDKAPVPWESRGAYADDPTFPAAEEIEPREVAGQVIVWKKGFKARWDVTGTTRTVEITDGANGWHSHIHVLLWTDAPASRKTAKALEDELYRRWAARCKAAKLPVPSRDRGVVVSPASRSKAGQKSLARYIAKVQETRRDGKDAGRALASEMTRSDWKLARGAKGRTAFELAELAAQGHEWALERWLEYERATKGRRCLTWSEGLREILAALAGGDAADPEDEELANADQEELQRRAPDVAITRTAFRGSVAGRRGGRADLTAAGDVGGLPAVLDLLDRWGLQKDRDYWLPDPLGPGLPTTATQFKRGQEVKRQRAARIEAAEAIPLSLTVQEWAAAQEKRRQTIAAQKAAAAAVTPAAVDVDEHQEQELAAARQEFLAARRRPRPGRAEELADSLLRFRKSPEADAKLTARLAARAAS